MIYCLPFGIAKEICRQKMQKDQGVVITSDHAFFVD